MDYSSPNQPPRRTSGADALGLLLSFAMVVWLLMWRQGRLGPFTYKALLLALGFAFAGWLLRGVDITGARAGFFVAFVFLEVGGWPLFSLLGAVFLLTLAATLAGRGRKQQLGLAEKKTGRSAAQVMANLAVATACIVLSTRHPVALVAAIAALAEIAADTVSSEIGEAFGGTPRLITTLSPAEVGAHGGVSWWGTAAGSLAALAVAGLARALSVAETKEAMVAGVAGIAGMFADSLLGAMFESRDRLTNNQVNFLGSSSAAALAAAAMLAI